MATSLLIERCNTRCNLTIADLYHVGYTGMHSRLLWKHIKAGRLCALANRTVCITPLYAREGDTVGDVWDAVAGCQVLCGVE